MQHRRPEDRPTRILAPITILAIVILSGALAMYQVGGGRWSLAEAFYLAINAVSTVGFSELHGMEDVRFARPVAVASTVRSATTAGHTSGSRVGFHGGC